MGPASRSDEGFTSVRPAGRVTTTTSDVNLHELTAQIERGDLDEMNEFQFTVYMQKVNRAFTNQRDVSGPVRGKAIDAYNRYLQKKLEEDASPIYLHLIGEHLAAHVNRNRGSSYALRGVYRRAVYDAFGKDAEEMRPEYRDMSLFRFVNVIQPISLQDRQSQLIVDQVTSLLQKEDEPKPIISLFRLMQKFTEDGANVNRHSGGLSEVIKVLNDPN